MGALDNMFLPSVSGIEIGGDGRPSISQNKPSLRRLLAACTATSLVTLATQDIAGTPQQAFKLERLYVNAAVATALFTINNIRVATFSLNVTNNALCIDMFLRDAVGSELMGYTAPAGVAFSINATNPSGGTVLFNPSFIGWAAVEG